MRQHFVPGSLALALLAPALAFGQTRTALDVALGGGAANGAALAGGISGDGRYAVFVSAASNLVAADTAAEDVFVRDIDLATTTRITSDGGALLSIAPPRISADGEVVGFSAQPAAGAELQRRAFVRRRATLAESAVAPDLFEVTLHDLSADGAFAAITARAAASAASRVQVYRVEVATGARVLVSRDANGNPIDEAFPELLAPRLDAAGARVAFATTVAGLAPNDVNGVADVFVFDVASASTTCVSVLPSGAPSASAASQPSLSADGRFVAFTGSHDGLVPGDANQVADVFVRDLELGVTTLASLTSAQAQFSTRSETAALAPGGVQVAFNRKLDTFSFPFERFELHVRDLETGITRAVDLGAGPLPWIFRPHGVSDGARRIVVESRPAPGSGARAVLVDFGAPCSVANYCAALPNSTGEAAFLGAQGEASREANSLVIAAVGVPRNAMTVLLMSDARVDPGVPFGHGLLCLGGALKRMGAHVATDGVVIAAQDMADPRYALVEPGDERVFQLWYRDAAAPGGGFNTTDAIAVTFCW